MASEFSSTINPAPAAAPPGHVNWNAGQPVGMLSASARNAIDGAEQLPTLGAMIEQTEALIENAGKLLQMAHSAESTLRGGVNSPVPPPGNAANRPESSGQLERLAIRLGEIARLQTFLGHSLQAISTGL